jgi:DNA repair exonuclease SbcCD ATPase subunit
MRIKEGGNINKSLLALSNVINKLSQNNKSFVNYRDSKLTRLLQTALGGNSKTSIICTMVDDNNHYSETLNTLHFGLKAKNIKTTVKANEVVNDKGKIAMENQALRNKIKMLEKLINDKKSLKDKENNNLENNINKAYSTLSSGNKNENNEQITNLEKEVSLLKRYLMNNEEMGSEINSVQGGADWMSMQGNDFYNNPYNINSGMSNINASAYKPSFKQRISNLSAIRGSGSAIKSTYFNSPCIPRQHQPEFNSTSINHMENLRRNICMTEMRPGAYAPKNFFHSAIRKTAPQNNNFMFGSNMKFSVPDLNNLNSTNFDLGNDYLIKENEELKKNIYELKKTYYEVVQSKEQQIKLLNQNHDMTLENCEKLIKEAEANYLNLKTEYDQVIDKMKLKDNELNDLKEKNLNQDSSINYYKKELNKVKDLNYASEIESKYNSLLEENIKLKQKEEEETAKLKEENDLLKKNIDMIDNKNKKKCKE